MAYTITSLSGNTTLVGTSGADQLTSSVAAGKSLNANSYEGIDNLTVSNAVDGGTIGMGGAVDTVTLSEAAKNLNITLGDGADTFSDTASKALSKVTVGGQGGADTFNLVGAAATSYFGGGKGKDIFRGTSSDGGTVGAATTIVGGSEVDTIGLSTDGIIFGAASFINGQVGADKIYVQGAAAGTVRGGSEADIISVLGTGTGALWLYGDKGADSVTGGSGADTIVGGGGSDTLLGGAAADSIDGGEGVDSILGGAANDTIVAGAGNDTINSGAGVDSISGGAGADDFILSDVVTSNDVELHTITDFSVSETDQIGKFSITDLETQADVSDIVSAYDMSSIAAGTAMSVTVVSSAYNLGTAGTGNILALSSSTAFTASTAADAMETGGDLELTVNGTWADEDSFIVIYDNNVDTFIALAETTGASDNALFGASAGIVINNFATLKGVSDASTIADANLLAFVA